MRSQTALLLLCVLLQASSANSKDLYVAVEEKIVIPLETSLDHTSGPHCNRFVWRHKSSADRFLQHIAEVTDICQKTDCRKSECSLSNNGSLILHRVTHQDSGLYNIITYHPNNNKNTEEDFHLHVLDALLDPSLDFSCHVNGSVTISCVVKSGADALYSWTVDGQPLQSDTNSSWQVNKNHITGDANSPWNVSCMAQNVFNQVWTPQQVIHCQVSYRSRKNVGSR